MLDEATSALDAHSEGIVQNALDRVSKSRTTVVIAHKLATVMKADNIIVVGQGEILEQGTHQELLEKKGAYAKLVSAQQLDHSRLTDHEEEEESDAESASAVEINREPMGKKLTSVKSWNPAEDPIEANGRNLVRILIMFVGENGMMWRYYFAVFFFSIIGGSYPCCFLAPF